MNNLFQIILIDYTNREPIFSTTTYKDKAYAKVMLNDLLMTINSSGFKFTGYVDVVHHTLSQS